jgi:hypothetical protein
LVGFNQGLPLVTLASPLYSIGGRPQIKIFSLPVEKTQFDFSFQKLSLCLIMLLHIGYCSAQTRTGIGLLGKPPTVKQFPSSRANRRTRLLCDLCANAGTKLTSVVEHNLYFARARDRWIN